MTDAERAKLAEDRRLIFKNLANGVPVESVMSAFHLSEKEVLDTFKFVSRKIWGYRFERAQPYIKCETPADASHQIAPLFESLGRLGPIALTSDHKFSHEKTFKLEDQVSQDAIQHIAAKQEGI